MKRTHLTEIIAALFILLFVYTATSKFLEFTSFRYVLSRSPLIGDKAPVLAWALPLLEFGISLLLFFPRTRRQGLWASLAIMIFFTGYLVYMIYFTPNRPCSCGGVLKQMSWKQHVIFNLFFVALAALALWMDRKRIQVRHSNHVTFSATA